MAQYRLLAGMHIQADETAEPIGSTQDPRTGDTTYFYPDKTYKAGDIVDTDIDLVDKFGAEKFQLLGEPEAVRQRRGTGSHTRGDPSPELVRRSPAEFPHGQVSTGFQQAKTGIKPEDDPNPERRSGPLNQEEVKALQAEHMEQGAEDAEAQEAEQKDQQKQAKAAEKDAKAAEKDTKAAEKDTKSHTPAHKATGHGSHGTSHGSSHKGHK